MADVDNPTTHVEDQNLSEPRVQPVSPQNEGIDPLTESDTMYPAEDTKTVSEERTQATNNADHPTSSYEASQQAQTPAQDTTLADQEARNAQANTASTTPSDSAPTDGSGSANAGNAQQS